MVLTRGRTLSVLIVVLVLAVGSIAVHSRKSLPSDVAARCNGFVAEVEFGALMGRSRPVRIRYRISADPPVMYEVTADSWLSVDPALPCPTTARLTVNAGDVWGGDTECWIEVNEVRVVEMQTRRREQCNVVVRLFQ